MSLPSYVNAGTSIAGTAAITVAPPSGIQANDILLLIIQSQGAQVATVPSGWNSTSINSAGTTISMPTVSAGTGITSTAIAVFWKRTTGTESSVSVADTGDHQQATMYAFRNCSTVGGPIDVVNFTSVTTASTTYTAPSITTIYPDNLVLVIFGNAVDGNPIASPNTASNASFGAAFLDGVNTNAGSGGGWTLHSYQVGPLSTTGTTTGTGTSSLQVNITLALRPEKSEAILVT